MTECGGGRGCRWPHGDRSCRGRFRSRTSPEPVRASKGSLFPGALPKRVAPLAWQRSRAGLRAGRGGRGRGSRVRRGIRRARGRQRLPESAFLRRSRRGGGAAPWTPHPTRIPPARPSMQLLSKSGGCPGPCSDGGSFTTTKHQQIIKESLHHRDIVNSAESDLDLADPWRYSHEQTRAPSSSLSCSC